ncbi:MAG: DEAD/DEAH box helicase family protein, partial [Deltaproteobacteria bacterium]|nr:DEAD/DEAH box helicase family protein [Deltaproteobacteria bacterium]
MRVKYKIQDFQTKAASAVADCFLGQGQSLSPAKSLMALGAAYDYRSPKNADLTLDSAQILTNVRAVQERHFLPLSPKLYASCGCPVNLDLEMETGTGKTYCYLKTIFELYKRYGWGHFIIVVPSIAIREGVLHALNSTADHFQEIYGHKAHYFTYDSRRLDQLDSFAFGPGVNVMTINIQAFNATSEASRRIYETLDELGSRRPIDVISSSQPILILDEPQKIEGPKTVKALAAFKPLIILRYSATHRVTRNKVYSLDAVTAYLKGLVKKVVVRGIAVKGAALSGAYVFFESVLVSKSAPLARLEIMAKGAKGLKRRALTVALGADLFLLSGQLPQYQGYVVTEIDAAKNLIQFASGETVALGEVLGDLSERTYRRIQIREAVLAHLEKERFLFAKGIKVLSLFFIDEVAKYRDYGRPDLLGEYARVFLEEYERVKRATLLALGPLETAYGQYLSSISAHDTHKGYFSIDRQTNRLVNPKFKTRGLRAGHADDQAAYDL